MKKHLKILEQKLLFAYKNCQTPCYIDIKHFILTYLKSFEHWTLHFEE